MAIEWWGKDTVFWKERNLEIGYPHVVLSQQFSLEHLEGIFKLTSILKKEIGKGIKKDWLAGNIVMTLFYEPSTRTRVSFETAALRLGADVISSESAAQFSSAIKGETLEDTIRIIADMVDLIVLRHKEDDSSIRASRPRFCQGVPIINAGAGKDQHPTQSLLDIFTIKENFGHIKDLKVAIAGDLKHGRTVRSLAYLLSKYPGIELYFVAPQVAQMHDDILAHLKENGVRWSKYEMIDEVISFVDVLYMTRFQTERNDPEEQEVMIKASEVNIITQEVADKMKEGSMILHPLPRIHEIRWGVDKKENARYFQQAANGKYVRMALLLAALNPQKAEELLAEAD